MFKRLLNLIKRQPEQPAPTTADIPQANSESQGIFNMPQDWAPLDSVSDTTRIPGTDLHLGTIGRVVETDRDERVEVNQRRGVSGGCGHLMFSISDIGGKCYFCILEAAPLFNQGLISQCQAEEHGLYCTDCASFCISCFRRICAIHTKLLQEPTGRFVPLCPVCYEKLTHENPIIRLLKVLIGN